MALNKKYKTAIRFLYAFMICLVGMLVIELFYRTSVSDQFFVYKVQRCINEIKKSQNEVFSNLCQYDNIREGLDNIEPFTSTDKKNNIILFAFKNDSLEYWNSNFVDPYPIITKPYFNDTILHFPTGNYFVSTHEKDEYDIYVVSILNTTYNIENPNYKNRFIPYRFMGSYEIEFSQENNGGYELKNNDGSILSYVKFKQSSILKTSGVYLYFLIYILIGILAYVFIFKALHLNVKLVKKPSRLYMTFLAISVFAYIIMLLLRKHLFILDSEIYLTNQVEEAFPNMSLGSITEIALLYFANITAAAICLSKRKKSKLKLAIRIIVSNVIIISIALLYRDFVLKIMPYMISPHGTEAIDIKPAFGMTIFLMLGFISIGALSFTNSILRHFHHENENKLIWIVTFSASLILCIVGIYEVDKNIWLTIGGIIMLYTTIMYTKQLAKKSNLIVAIIQIMTMSVWITLLYDINKETKIENSMRECAMLLTDENDEDFEKAHQSFSNNIKQDTVLRNLLFSDIVNLDDNILFYLEEKHFDETIKDYEIYLTICEPEEELYLESVDYVVNCENYFSNIIELNPSERIEKNLYNIDYNTLECSYISKHIINNREGTEHKTLYIEFFKSIVPKEFNTPKLLQNGKRIIPFDFSIASYKNGILVYKMGDFLYPNFIKDIGVIDEGIKYSSKFRHYTTTIKEDDKIIVSYKRNNWVERVSPFCYFFIEILLIYLIGRIIIGYRIVININPKLFRHKLQLVMLFTLLLSISVIGPISVIYMRTVYNTKSSNFRFERLKSLLLELKDEVNKDILEKAVASAELNSILERFSNTFFTDINLYSKDGSLIGTTRPEIYDMNLKAPLMDAAAFSKLHNNIVSSMIQEEYMGEGKYQSAYVTIRDYEGNIIAYLNIPYLSSRVEFSAEITGFILTYINILIVMMGLSSLLVMWVTKKLTKPLSQIQEKMSQVKIDKSNEPIEYKGQDEIGQLINQYNKLIVEVEKSANNLARSEREATWREMARQVAHEIKNPLTPMRLSVQMLQKSWREGKTDSNERMEKTTQILIEQIDTLSQIASAFSEYGKLPVNKPEVFDLRQMIDNVMNLYSTENNIAFKFTADTSTDYSYYGDKNNISRAIGNIIKNAVQAIDTNREGGKIEVILKSTKIRYIISITDNGRGIKEEEKSKIFLPNFTTKSSGMGVGLSIVYNTIHSEGGRINFESEENKGTTFIIELFKNRE